MADKPDAAKRKAGHPPGEFSPTIYPEEVDEATMRRAFDFEREKMRGKPLSQTVIEDRGPEMTAMNDDRKAELEREIAALIQKRLPQAAGRDVKIEIFENNGGGSGDAWNPVSGEIRIAFGSPSPPDALGGASYRRLDLIASLNRAEFLFDDEFVSLEWFRDRVLPDDFPWARESAARSREMNAALVDGIILTCKRCSPDCALTTVRLNWRHPEVADALDYFVRRTRGTETDADKRDPEKRKATHPLGKPSPDIYPKRKGDPATRPPFEFPLIKLSGKPLSQTVIEERREARY